MSEKVYCEECKYHKYTSGDMGGWEDCLKEKVLGKDLSHTRRPEPEWARPCIKNKNRDCLDFEKIVRSENKSIWEKLFG